MRSIIFIIIIFNLNLFSQNEDTKFIRWDRVGQKVTLKKGTDFRILYGKANPETTEIKFSQSSNDSEFTLELVEKQGPPPHMPPMPPAPDIAPIIKTLEGQIDELQQSNDSLVKLLSTNSEDITNEPSAVNEEIIEKVSKELTQEYELSEDNDQIEEKIKTNEKKIETVKSEINKNLEEFDQNQEKIDQIREKIQYLKNNNGNPEDIASFQAELEELINRNHSLQKQNQLLSFDRDRLIKENKLKELELQFQTRLRNIFIALTGLVVLLALVIFNSYRNKKKANLIIKAEQKKSEDLLHNILPVQIASRLKDGEMIADNFTNASVIFIDIVGFTKLSEKVRPGELINILNDIFTSFDKIASKYNIEKIKTIGDCYMAASGIPEKDPEQLLNMLNMTIDCKKEMHNYRSSSGHDIEFRIGIESGPVVAGVIGEKKFIYDLWGDTVNIAARMEEFGEKGKIHISDKLKQEIDSKYSSKFSFEERGVLNIKGKGEMKTWFLDIKN